MTAIINTISSIIASLSGTPMTLESGITFPIGNYSPAEATRLFMENSPFFISMTSNGGIQFTNKAGEWLTRTSRIIEIKTLDNGYCYLVTENGHKYNLTTFTTTPSPTVNELINAIFKETKRQENKRAEYLSLVHNLIDNTERKEEAFYWKINFRYYEDRIGRKRVSFSQGISMRKEGELSSFDIKNTNEVNKEIDCCINTLYDFGEDTLDKFIEHLVKIAIPQFLQDRYPRNYDVY